MHMFLLCHILAPPIDKQDVHTLKTSQNHIKTTSKPLLNLSKPSTRSDHWIVVNGRSGLGTRATSAIRGLHYDWLAFLAPFFMGLLQMYLAVLDMVETKLSQSAISSEMWCE